MSNRYTIRYNPAKNRFVITSVSTWSELNDILKCEAKNSIVEFKGLDMPKLMFDLIVTHNAKINGKNKNTHP